MPAETFTEMFQRVTAAVNAGEMTAEEASTEMTEWSRRYSEPPAFNYDTDSMSPFGQRGAGR